MVIYYAKVLNENKAIQEGEGLQNIFFALSKVKSYDIYSLI